MKSLLSMTALVLFLCPKLYSQAGYAIGSKVASFSLVNAVDNTKTTLSDFGKYKSIVIVFTNNSCPYSKLYEGRILQLATEFEPKNVKFILVNPSFSSSAAEDTPAGMAKLCKEKNYSVPFLIDDHGDISRQFGAGKTPESFVLKNINGIFFLHYKGAIDDNPQVASDVSNHYLQDALNSVVSNTSIKIVEKRAAGCMIQP